MWIHHDPSWSIHIHLQVPLVHFNVNNVARHPREVLPPRGWSCRDRGLRHGAEGSQIDGRWINHYKPINKTHIDIYIDILHIIYADYSFIPFHSIPFHSIPFHSIPFHSIHSFKLFLHSLTGSFVHSFIHPSVHSFTHSFMQCFMTEGYLVGFDTLFEFNTCPLVSLQPDICKIHRIPIDLPMDIPRCWLWSPRFRHVAPLRPGEMVEPRAAERHGRQRLYGPDLLGGLSDGAGRGGSTLGGDWRSRDIQYLTSAPMIMSVYIYFFFSPYTLGYVYRYWIKQIVDNSKSLMLIALHLARAKYTLRLAPAA